MSEINTSTSQESIKVTVSVKVPKEIEDFVLKREDDKDLSPEENQRDFEEELIQRLRRYNGFTVVDNDENEEFSGGGGKKFPLWDDLTEEQQNEALMQVRKLKLEKDREREGGPDKYNAAYPTEEVDALKLKLHGISSPEEAKQIIDNFDKDVKKILKILNFKAYNKSEDEYRIGNDNENVDTVVLNTETALYNLQKYIPLFKALATYFSNQLSEARNGGELAPNELEYIETFNKFDEGFKILVEHFEVRVKKNILKAKRNGDIVTLKDSSVSNIQDFVNTLKESNGEISNFTKRALKSIGVNENS